MIADNISVKNVKFSFFYLFVHFNVKTHLLCPFYLLWPGGAGGKGVWGAAGMVYEDEEPDTRDPNYDEVAQVRGWLMIDVEKLRPQNRHVAALTDFDPAASWPRPHGHCGTCVSPTCISAATVCSVKVLCYSTACKD